MGMGLCKRESRRRSNIRCMVGQKSAGWAHVCCSPHETEAAGCPCRLAIWYCFGEIPNWAEKALVRWLGLENPHRYAISVMFFPFSLRSLRAHSRRSRRRMPKTVSSKSILNKARQPCAVDPHGGCQFGQARRLSDILEQYGIGSVRGPALRRADAFVAVFPVQEFDLLIEQFVFLVRQEYVSQEAVVPAVEDLLEENAKVQRDVSFERPG